MEGRTVVVVEDDDHIADLVALYLGRARVPVAWAGRADEGLALVAEHRLALAVVDIGLPGGVDGLELCRRLRRDSPCRSSSSPPGATRPTGWSAWSWAPTTT